MSENIVTFGADPEFFAVSKNSRVGLATSAHLLPLVSPTSRARGLKPDGFAVEFNPEPNICRDSFRSLIYRCLTEFNRIAPGHRLDAAPKRRLTKASLRNPPDGVLNYGCTPDRNAYLLEDKDPPAAGYHDDFRYTGGHLHWSTSNKGELAAAAYTIFADLTLGVPLVAILGESNDYGEADRRQYYGQAGSHRVTKYGFEYRVPSSIIFASPVLLTWAIGQLRRSIIHMNVGRIKKSCGCCYNFEVLTDANLKSKVVQWDKLYDFQRVQHIINNHDVGEARVFVENHKETLFKNMYEPKFYDLMYRADIEGIAFNTDLDKNWKVPHPSGNQYPIQVGPGVIGAMTGNSARFIDNAFPQAALLKPKAPAWG